MRSALQLSIVLCVVLWPAQQAAAYGPTGHRIAGAIAEDYLCDAARENISELLDGESLGSAGRWPDWIRSDPKWRHTRPWHYVNVPDGASVADVPYDREGNVLQAIARLQREVADPDLSGRQRAESLSFLAHFVADVHQPLHVGRVEDRGGNAIELVVFGKPTNLHALWDAEQLLRMDKLGLDEQIRALQGLAIGQVDDWQVGDHLVWADESMQLRELVYSFEVEARGETELPHAYLVMARNISGLRLVQAGVRLAGSLNTMFCKAP
jgi:hypothetical protein